MCCRCGTFVPRLLQRSGTRDNGWLVHPQRTAVRWLPIEQQHEQRSFKKHLRIENHTAADQRYLQLFTAVKMRDVQAPIFSGARRKRSASGLSFGGGEDCKLFSLCAGSAGAFVVFVCLGNLKNISCWQIDAAAAAAAEQFALFVFTAVHNRFPRAGQQGWNQSANR